MSNDPERGPDDRPPDQPEEPADIKEREGLVRFATYTSPALLALLVSDRARAFPSTS